MVQKRSTHAPLRYSLSFCKIQDFGSLLGGKNSQSARMGTSFSHKPLQAFPLTYSTKLCYGGHCQISRSFIWTKPHLALCGKQGEQDSTATVIVQKEAGREQAIFLRRKILGDFFDAVKLIKRSAWVSDSSSVMNLMKFYAFLHCKV